MSQQSTPVFKLSIKASAAVAARRFVTHAGAQAGAGANAAGVSEYAAASGEMFPAVALGTAVVEAGAAFAAGAALQADADGRAITKDAGAAVARALQAAGAAGDLVEVFLIPN
jgi:hypothetical protein